MLPSNPLQKFVRVSSEVKITVQCVFKWFYLEFFCIVTDEKSKEPSAVGVTFILVGAITFFLGDLSHRQLRKSGLIEKFHTPY